MKPVPSAIAKMVARAAVFVAFGVLPACAPAAAAQASAAPEIPLADRGASIDDVSIETYRASAVVALRYLTLKKGAVLVQQALDVDFANLSRLAGLRPRLLIQDGSRPGHVSLRWIVMSKTLQTTDRPFYADQPLTAPILGFGYVLTSHALDSSGSTLSSYSQFALRAQLVRIVYTKPLWVAAAKGREGDFILNVFGARGVYRATQPVTQDVYSWLAGEEALYLQRDTSGNQVEFGLRFSRSTSAKPSYLTAPSVFDTYHAPSQNTTLEAAAAHACTVPPTQWYPPYCSYQYRVEGVDSIGGFGANTRYRTFVADAAHYTRVGSSTLAVHGSLYRSAGVVPTSSLVCAYSFGFAKATCGTDANLIAAEFRIADARPGPLKFVLFTETASSRVNGSTQSFIPNAFAWRADSGAGILYRGLRFNVAYGNQGGRITYEVQGQLF